MCGKDFAIIRTTTGKTFFYGKAAALGLKSVSKTPTLKPVEMIVSKTASVTQVAIGHDGIHALLVCDDGSAYFSGTARRGEDGDSSKNRRQPKANKPKKLAKLEEHFVVQVACNNGTSAFVTKTGKLIMYGKDTTHCDASGLVTQLSDQHISRVALGKAHCVAVNAKGQLFTFGINNKGQCGRSMTATASSTGNGTVTAPLVTIGINGSAAVPSVQANVSNRSANEVSVMCDFEEHQVEQGQCRVCAFCRECTGYNISCVVTQTIAIDQRVPGA